MAAAAVPTITLCNRTDMESKLSQYGVVGALDDNNDGSEDTPTSTDWVTQACQQGTNKVFRYLLAKYDQSELALSPIACGYAILFSCRWLLGRRGNPVPAELAEEIAEALLELKEIQKGEAILPDAAPRNNGLPSYMNYDVNRNFPFGKVRVIRPESDNSPADFAVRPDYAADYYPYR